MTLPDPEALRRVAEAADNGPGPLSKLADREWQDLLDKDDRTSPEEYPEMALIDRAEFGGVMSEAYLLARDAAANRISELEARVGVLEGAMRMAADLLAERAHGNPARSPGHNARLVLEAALTPHQEKDQGR